LVVWNVFLFCFHLKEFSLNCFQSPANNCTLNTNAYLKTYTQTLNNAILKPTYGQFGVGGGRKTQQQQNTKFQELQELAKKQQGGTDDDAVAGGGAGGAGLGGLGNILDGMDTQNFQKLWADAMNDPSTMDKMKQYGGQFGSALEKMMDMDPTELQQQLNDAMKLMSNGDIVDTVLQQKEQVLQTLEATGTVPPEELAKYRADPEYFESQMRQSFSQMKDIFTNPEYLSKAADVMKNMKDVLGDPDIIYDLTKSLGAGGDGTGLGDFTSDEKLEEIRLQFLNGQMSGIPGIDEIFNTPEMQEVLQDPIKWKQTVKDGLEDILNLGAAGTADILGGGVPTARGMTDEL
jgi:hypothetical protein